jgi:hypothetical protein
VLRTTEDVLAVVDAIKTQPRNAAEIPEWELEEMIRDVIEQTMRRDIADSALTLA